MRALRAAVKVLTGAERLNQGFWSSRSPLPFRRAPWPTIDRQVGVVKHALQLSSLFFSLSHSRAVTFPKCDFILDVFDVTTDANWLPHKRVQGYFPLPMVLP
jgi:hypothetical protein